MNECLSRVRAFLQTHHVSPQAPILIGISGGPDSVWLAYALHQLGYIIGLAHVNYHLRGEDSDRDEALVRSYAEQWSVPLFVYHATWEHNPAKNNLQQAARDIRYQFFEEISTQHGYPHVATAHHQDDQVESMIMSLFGGGDEQIITAIPATRGPFIRPLLSCTKADIYTALESAKLAFREDQTNAEAIYTRNHVRLTVLPFLDQTMPGFRQILIRKLGWQQQKEAVLQSYLKKTLAQVIAHDGEGEGIQYAKLSALSATDQLPLLLQLLLDQWQIYGPIRREIYELASATTGKFIPYRHHLIRRTREGLFRYPAPVEPLPESVEIDLKAGAQQVIWFSYHLHIQPDYQGEIAYTPDVLFLDQAYIQGTLTIRSWMQGDQMIPLGMKGHKKLSDIFIDEKFTPYQKATVPVLVDQHQIVGVGAFRVAEGVKIRPTTTQIVRIDLIKKQVQLPEEV